VSKYALSARAAFGDRTAESGGRTGLRLELRKAQRDQPVGSARGAKDQGVHGTQYSRAPRYATEPWAPCVLDSTSFEGQQSLLGCPIRRARRDFAAVHQLWVCATRVVNCRRRQDTRVIRADNGRWRRREW